MVTQPWITSSTNGQQTALLEQPSSSLLPASPGVPEHLRMRQTLQHSQAPSCFNRFLDTGKSLWGCQDCVFCCLNYTSSEEDTSRYINFVVTVLITIDQKVYAYMCEYTHTKKCMLKKHKYI